MKTNGFFTRYAAAFKLFVVGMIMLLLLIPTQMIRSLIGERQSRKNEVTREISRKWGRTQFVTGPVLQIPFEKLIEREKKLYRETDFVYLLPEMLDIDGKIQAEEKRRNIYKTVIYEADVKMQGHFDLSNIDDLNVNKSRLQWDRAKILLGIEDLGGIREQIVNTTSSGKVTFEAGVTSNTPVGNGLYHPIRLEGDSIVSYDFTVALNGSKGMYFSPVGKVTTTHLQSDWPAPSFQGSFVTDDYNLDTSGFSAHWKILDLNRSLPHAWTGDQTRIQGKYSYGVELDEGVDLYQKTERSVKYAALILGLSFLSFFLFEVLNGKSIHPVQYVFIGLTLVIFYSLLLSFAETIGFDGAYLISSLATILLISIYSVSILGTWKKALTLGAILVVLYGFIYVILQLATYSLLFGSIGLFLFLAAVMMISRKIDWYANPKKPQDVSA
jgi:inner membrane protein